MPRPKRSPTVNRPYINCPEGFDCPHKNNNGCGYFHKLCRYGLSCTRGDGCYYRHMPKPCKNDGRCTQDGCQFSHPKPSKEVQPCRYGRECRRDGCWFAHPPPQPTTPSQKFWADDDGDDAPTTPPRESAAAEKLLNPNWKLTWWHIKTWEQWIEALKEYKMAMDKNPTKVPPSLLLATHPDKLSTAYHARSLEEVKDAVAAVFYIISITPADVDACAEKLNELLTVASKH